MMNIILGYLLTVNIVSFFLYGIDKYKAKKDNKRLAFEYDPHWIAEGFSISPLELPLKSAVQLVEKALLQHQK